MALALHNAKGLSGLGAQAEVKSYTAGNTIVAGDWVSVVTGKVVQSNAGVASAKTAIGVALEAAVADAAVRVVTAGPVQANCDNSVAAGNALMPTGTNGRASKATYDSTTATDAVVDLPAICGEALTAAAGNVATCYVYRSIY